MTFIFATILVIASCSAPGGMGLEPELQIEVHSDLLNANNCTSAVLQIQERLEGAYGRFWVASGRKKNLSPRIVLVVPENTCQLNTFNKTRRGVSSVRVWTGATSVLQHKGCGARGLSLNINQPQHTPRELQDVDQLVVSLTQFLFGVFPEHGLTSSQRFPIFFQNKTEVSLNSCSNIEIRGNFTEQCFAEEQVGGCLAEMEVHPAVTSSLLFSTQTNKFPNMSLFCGPENHVKHAPNPHNLICRDKSILQVLSVNEEVPFLLPEVKVLQRESEGSVFFFLDRGPTMRAEDSRLWRLFRVGLATSFQATGPKTRFTVRYPSDSNINITDTPKLNYADDIWRLSVFPDHISTEDPPLDAVNDIFNNLDLIERIGCPALVIVTANTDDINSHQFDKVLEFVVEQRLAVFVISFSSAPINPLLVKLTAFGGIFSIEENAGNTNLGAEAWSIQAFHYIFAKIRNVESVVKRGRIEKGTFATSQDFVLTSSDVLSPGRLVLLVPQAANPAISLTSPANKTFSNPTQILQVWDSQVPVQVLYSVGDQGTWTINATAEQDGIDFLFCTETSTVQPAVWHQFREAPEAVNGTKDKSVTVYSYNPEGSEKTIIASTGGHPAEAIKVVDNGLLAPDTMAEDGIYSGHFYQINRTGCYNLWREIRSPSQPEGLEMIYIELSPGFVVSVPTNQAGPDTTAPARITDLVVIRQETTQLNNIQVSIGFTEPGDDNFDNGEVQLYYLYCGADPDEVSYQLCSSIKGRVRLPTAPGNFKIITLNVESFDAPVYVGITAQDSSGNMGEMSNIVSVFVPAQSTTIPSTATSTTATATTTTSEVGGEEDSGVSAAVFWWVTGTLLVLTSLLVLAIGLFALLWHRRKKREKKHFLEAEFSLDTLEPSYPNTKVAVDARPEKRPRTSRTKTKTNGSLKEYMSNSFSDSSTDYHDNQERSGRKQKRRKKKAPFGDEPIYKISSNTSGLPRVAEPGSHRSSAFVAYRPQQQRSGRYHYPSHEPLPTPRAGSVRPPPPPVYPKPNPRIRDDIYSAPSDYLMYINNNRLPVIYGNERSLDSASLKGSHPDLIKQLRKEVDSNAPPPFNYISHSLALAQDKPSQDKPKNISFV